MLSLQVPHVHLTFGDIAKATNHEDLTKRTNFYRVSELLTEFKCRLTIQIVHRSHCWLLTRDNNELMPVLCPLDILNLVVENWNELSILAFMNSNILKSVLSIITLSSSISLILGPNENCMSRRSWNYLDIVSSWTSNVKLWPLKITVQVVDIYEAIVLRFREAFAILPCHQVAGSVSGANILRWNWTKEEAIEPTVVDPIVILSDSINLWEWWQL